MLRARIGFESGFWAISFLAIGLSTACGGATTFQGATPIEIAATPLPPPPPPPPPPPVVAAPKPPPRVELVNNEIVIHEKVQFDLDKAIILPVSDSLLDEVADVIGKNPQITKIEIQGHASSEGKAKHNTVLSDARAKAVMAYLVSKGVSKNMLTAKGYGSSVPLADNSTEEGRETNRRVQFMITNQTVTEKKVEIDPTTGKQRVLEEKKTEKVTQ
jgi:outer membrane protein OmpA-like peptidoglycan-associated protein